MPHVIPRAPTDSAARAEIATRPFGPMMLSAMEHAEWRAAVLAQLRAAPGATRAGIARQMRVDARFVQRLLDGGEVPEQAWPAAREWAAALPRPLVHLEEVAVQVLLAWVPGVRLPAARADLLRTLAEFYGRHRAVTSAWLDGFLAGEG